MAEGWYKQYILGLQVEYPTHLAAPVSLAVNFVLAAKYTNHAQLSGQHIAKTTKLP